MVYLNRTEVGTDQLLVFKEREINGETLYQLVLNASLMYDHFEQKECAGQSFVLDVDADGKIKVAYSLEYGTSTSTESHLELVECERKAFALDLDESEKARLAYLFEDGRYYGQIYDHLKLQKCEGKTFVLDRDEVGNLGRYIQTGASDWVDLCQKRRVDLLKEINGNIYLFDLETKNIYDSKGALIEF